MSAAVVRRIITIITEPLVLETLAIYFKVLSK